MARNYPEDVIMLDVDEDFESSLPPIIIDGSPADLTSASSESLATLSPSLEKTPPRTLSPTLSDISSEEAPWEPEPEAPWGAPANGTRTIYPPNFRRSLRTLISLVPLQRPGPLGRNLKPLIISVFSNSFTNQQLNCIANLLSLAPQRIIKDMAILLAAIVRECWVSLGDEDILMLFPGQQRYWASVQNWLERLSDAAVARAVGREDMTGMEAWHMLSLHVTVTSRPRSGERIAVRFEICPEMEEARPGTRTLEGVKAFVAGLPIVGKEEIRAGGGVDGSCCICLEEYYQTSAEGGEVLNDRPLRLGCGHVVGGDCLERLFGPKEWADMEVSSCPLCRAKVEFEGFAKSSV
ncbi:hypothetical protein G7Y79_00031g066370 [Physcia stellaris]|nr:hypothetical protein G7Y79_00031g066370 [Physcia stellaris]